ncbi:PR-1-like protein [Ceratobasidium sp. AG-I]|nr:PR-1-like protein [Ceratobasidium sp. AG-I]
MLFVRLSTATTALAIVFSATLHTVSATGNQQIMDCEEKCSQRWSFPAPASPTTVSSKIVKPKTTTYTTSSSSVHTTSYTPPPPAPTSTSIVVHNAQVKSSSSTKEQAAAATPPPAPSSTKEAAPKPTPTPTPEPSPSPSPAASVSSSSGVAAYLDPHNAARAEHGAAPLSWSDDLAAAAQRWANNCVFEHSGGSLGPYGENLAAGSGEYSPGSGVKAWVNEAPEYSSSNPVPSHFTQVVWKATTQVGCAVASCNLSNFDQQFWPVKFHVCEYSSAGNVIGQFAANVQA